MPDNIVNQCPPKYTFGQRAFIIGTSDFAPTLAFNALASLVWCIWLFAVPDVFGSTRSYSSLGQVATEQVWGVWMGVLTVLQFYILYRPRPRNGDGRFLGFGLLAVAFTWMFVAASILYAGPKVFGGPIYGLTALFACWVYLRYRLMLR